jgi:hypothetical protein
VRIFCCWTVVFFEQFFLISSVVQILGLHFSSIEIMHLHIVAKNELGHILGDFFTSSSGHAGREYGRSGT